jgi:hypothetical protein
VAERRLIRRWWRVATNLQLQEVPVFNRTPYGQGALLIVGCAYLVGGGILAFTAQVNPGVLPSAATACLAAQTVLAAWLLLQRERRG